MVCQPPPLVLRNRTLDRRHPACAACSTEQCGVFGGFCNIVAGSCDNNCDEGCTCDVSNGDTYYNGGTRECRKNGQMISGACTACTVCSPPNTYMVSDCREGGEANNRVCTTPPPSPPPSPPPPSPPPHLSTPHARLPSRTNGGGEGLLLHIIVIFV